MDNLDKLAMVSKSLFDVRVVEQRQEIEKLKKKLKEIEQKQELIREICKKCKKDTRINIISITHQLRLLLYDNIIEYPPSYDFFTDLYTTESNNNGCSYIHSRGSRKGMTCLQFTFNDSKYCKYHLHPAFQIDIQEIIKDLLGLDKK